MEDFGWKSPTTRLGNLPQGNAARTWSATKRRDDHQQLVQRERSIHACWQCGVRKTKVLIGLLQTVTALADET